MNHGALIKRAFTITKRFPVLWIFGILVALTSGGSSGGNGSGYNFNEADLRRQNWPAGLPVQQWLDQTARWIEQFDPGRYVGWFIACCCLLVIFILVALIVQYVARAALMRSVDQIEATGSAPTWSAGFRLGWSRRSFRLWLLELIVGIAVALAALALMALGASPLLLLLTQSDAARAIGIGLTVLLGLPVILILIAAAIAFYVLDQFWSREIVLGDRGIGDALAAGWADVRRRLKDVGVLWLLMAAIRIGYTIVLVPVFFVLLLLAGLAGGGLGYAVYTSTHFVGWAIAVGAPIFLLILGVPLTFIGGLYETFKSSAWTLAYREVAA
jgi:hypothetical protein